MGLNLFWDSIVAFCIWDSIVHFPLGQMRAETNANAFFDPTPPPHPPLRAVSNVSDCIGTFASLLVKRNTVRI